MELERFNFLKLEWWSSGAVQSRRHGQPGIEDCVTVASNWG